MDALIDILAKWRWMSGVSTNNQDEVEVAKELVLISQFIVKNYPNINLDEINLAIDLSLTNKLDVDVKTYNVFSPMYVSRILNAYIEYKKPIVKGILERKENSEKEKEMKKDVTPQEKMDSMIELITYFYEENQQKGFISDHFNTLFNYFRRTKLLKTSAELIEDAQKYGKEKGGQHIDNYFSDFMNNSEKPKLELLEKRFARNYCVQDFFNKNQLNFIISLVELKHFS